MDKDTLMFSYCCNSCGDTQNNFTMESFTCDCGGDYKLTDGIKTDIFASYYDETLKMRIHSAAQRNREFKKAGLYVSQDDYKMMRRWKDQREFKEDIHQEMMKSAGRTYKPGSKKEWDENKQDFAGGSHRLRKYFIAK